MHQLPDRIRLIKVADNTIVTATIVKLTRNLAQAKIDGNWWEMLGVSTVKRQQEDDHNWRWAKRVGELKNDRWHEAVAVQTEDDNVQGAILYRLNTKSFVEQGQGAVYVEALATAPRNRPWLVASTLYRGVGENLLLRAVIHSYSLGLEGRVNLVSFNSPRTITFYEKRGLIVVGYEDDGLSQLELAPNAATAWLREEGYDI